MNKTDIEYLDFTWNSLAMRCNPVSEGCLHCWHIKRAKMLPEAENEADRQLKRLDQMHPESAEANIVRTYLDWLVDMPWNKTTKDVLDIRNAQQVLDSGHHALEKVKDRILDYLSVRKLNPKMKGPILCFVGPPGVGKTSLGRAIAGAIKRKFIRISLGGIRDEAEIRGHRRTYIGALPGRVLQGLRQCGSNKLTSLGPIFAVIRHLPCWKPSILSRIRPSAIIISTCRLICQKSCLFSLPT